MEQKLNTEKANNIKLIKELKKASRTIEQMREEY
jgi:hypothetical protein